MIGLNFVTVAAFAKIRSATNLDSLYPILDGEWNEVTGCSGDGAGDVGCSSS